MCGINNVLDFKGGTNHKRKEDILLFISLLLLPVVSCKCKGYDWEQSLLCSPFICYLSFDKNFSSFNNQNVWSKLTNKDIYTINKNH